MRRIAGRLLVATCVVGQVPVFFYVGTLTPDYYSTHPERLAYALVMAAWAGILVLAFHRFARRDRRGRWQFSLGAALLVVTAIAWVLAMIRMLAM